MIHIAAQSQPDLTEFKKSYMKLITTIPRKIENLKDYVNRVSLDSNDANYIQTVTQKESDLLQAFEDTYNDAKNAKENAKNKSGAVTLADFGLKVVPVLFSEKFEALDDLDNNGNGSQAHTVSHFISIVNSEKKNNFDTYAKQHNVQSNEIYTMWHGTCKNNLWSIIKNGLSLQYASPHGLYGAGLYFGPHCDKSYGYGDHLYMLRANVIMQKMYECDAGSYFPAGYDSISSGINRSRYEERIVYNEDQQHIQSLVKFDTSRQSFQFKIHQLMNMNFDKSKLKNIEISSGHSELCAAAHVVQDINGKTVCGDMYVAVPVNKEAEPFMAAVQPDGSLKPASFRKDVTELISERYMQSMGAIHKQQPVKKTNSQETIEK